MIEFGPWFEIPDCEKQLVAHIRSVDFGDCDDDGNRPVRLISRIIPEDVDGVVVQWYVDGEPFSQPRGPGTFAGKVKGDGTTHTVELRVVAPEGAEGDTEQVEIPECEPADCNCKSTSI